MRLAPLFKCYKIIFRKQSFQLEKISGSVTLLKAGSGGIQIRETCKRTDYMSKDRVSVLPQIYGSVKRQIEANRTECLLEKLYKL